MLIMFWGKPVTIMSKMTENPKNMLLKSMSVRVYLAFCMNSFKLVKKSFLSDEFFVKGLSLRIRLFKLRGRILIKETSCFGCSKQSLKFKYCNF